MGDIYRHNAINRLYTKWEAEAKKRSPAARAKFLWGVINNMMEALGEIELMELEKDYGTTPP